MVVKKKKRSSDDGPTTGIGALIRENPTYLKAKKRLTHVLEDIDFDLLKTELFSLHTSRGTAALKGSVVIRDSVRVIIDSSVDEIGVRSRCTTISMTALKALLDIDEIYSHLSKYLLSKYATQLRSSGDTTITAQRATIDVYLRIFVENKKRLEGVMKLSDMVTKDIDQAGYGLKNIKDVITLVSKDR